MNRHFLLLPAFVLALGWPAAPLEAQPKDKPAIEIKTRAAEIIVTIDNRLNTHPGLAADLLAEGRRFANKARTEADAAFKSNSRDFREGRRWAYDRTYHFRSLVAGRYVSVLSEDETYKGGAHPNNMANTILWDLTTRRRISVRPFFNETADNGPTMTALARLVRRAVAVEKLARQALRKDVESQTDAAKIAGWARQKYDVAEEKKEPQPTAEELAETDDGIISGVQPQLLKIGPISLAPSTVAGKSSGLAFHFSPYAVDSYMAGSYRVFVPWRELRPYLSAEGLAIFDGERPKSDDAQ